MSVELLEDRRLLARTLFVDADASSGGTGSSWNDAFTDLQPALESASLVNADADPGNDVEAIWIAEGMYLPSALLEDGEARSASFSLVDGVTLYGGFAGNETALEQRDWSTHVTTLSGDLGAVDDTADNAYTVVYCAEQITAGLDGVEITAGNADGTYASGHAERAYGGGVCSNGTLSVAHATIAGNSAKSGGGAIFVGGGSMVIGQSSVANNRSQGSGGGIANLAQLTVANSTISENSTQLGNGGGIHGFYGETIVTNCSILGNTSKLGGGISHERGSLSVQASSFVRNSATYHGGGINSCESVLRVANAVIVGNTAARFGGGIYSSGDTNAVITNTTISANVAADDGGGVYGYGDALTIANSILSLNAGDDLFGSFQGSNNLISVDPKFAGTPSSGADGTWGTEDDDWGDLRLTDRSPAVNGGNNLLAVDANGDPLTTDLGGLPRIADGIVDIGAYEYQGAPAVGRETPSLVVTATHDEVDLYDGTITLREAVYYSQMGIGDRTITFDSALDRARILLEGNELLLDHPVTIDASALSSLIVDAQSQSRVFLVRAEVALCGLAITGGNADEGGGVLNAGELTVNDCILFGNRAEESGGAISSDGALTLNNTTISQNMAQGSGGGVYISGTATVAKCLITANIAALGGGISSSGTLSVAQSTLTVNSASSGGGGISNLGILAVVNATVANNAALNGGGIYNNGALTVRNSTIVGNSAFLSGGGVDNANWPGSSMTLDNTIVADNGAPSGRDIWFPQGTLEGSHNLISDGSGQSVLTDGVDGNQVGTASEPLGPRLSDWVQFDNGQWGLRPLPDSPALDAGDNALAVNGDGEPLVQDIGGSARIGNLTVDIGAAEGAVVVTSRQTYLVTSLEDSVAADGVVTFREAFEAANGNRTVGDAPAGSATDQDVIQFARGTTGTLSLRDRELIINGDLTIRGPGSDLLTFDAGQQSCVFLVWPNASVQLSGMTITGGQSMLGGGICSFGDLKLSNSVVSHNVATEDGGGIYAAYGKLTLVDSVVRGNTAGSSGGGVKSLGMLGVWQSTFFGNAAGSDGGGLSSSGGSICNVTFTQNFAGAYGGAVHSSGNAILQNATLIGNQAGDGGGGLASSSGALVNNSILSANVAAVGPNIMTLSGSSVHGSHNLIADGTGQTGIADAADGNLVGDSSTPLDPMVSGLMQLSNGQWGFYPLPCSPAVDAGSHVLLPADTEDLDGDGNTSEPLPEDVAGSPRVGGEDVDIGACEFPPQQFHVMTHEPKKLFDVGQSAVTLRFNRELTTLSPSDVVLSGPDGVVSILGVSRTGVFDGQSEYAIHFPPLDGFGVYQLTVLATVRDEDGTSCDQDLDGVFGEPEDDRYVATWTLAGPRVASYEPHGTMPALLPLDHFDIRFSTAMDQSSFSLDDVEELTGPAGAIEPSGYAWLDAQTLRVSFEPISLAGSVSITIGTEISDQWGNPLDQNQNAVPGEADDSWTGVVAWSLHGTVEQDMLIPSSVGLVCLEDDLIVAAGVTLTIEPGVTFKFASGAGLMVHGNLVVQGTTEAPVVFTSWKDDAAGGDTNGDGNATSPSRADWAGIYAARTGAHIQIDHVVIRYAEYGVETLAGDTSWRVSNSVISDNNFGLAAHHQQNLAAEAVNCLIVNNGTMGVYFHEYFAGVLRNCTIVGNGFAGEWGPSGVHQVGTLVMDNCIVAFNRHGFDSNAEPDLDIRNSLFYNPAGNELHFTSGFASDVLTRNANIVADPLFADRDTGNYALAAGSPAIDAGTGFHAPQTDFLGAARYDDAGMPNTGGGYPAFVDIGALERQSSTMAVDLAVTSVTHSAIEAISPGENLEITWTVTNQGLADAAGLWTDKVYFSQDRYYSPDDLPWGNTFVHTGPLAAGQSYTQTLTATLPELSGPMYVLVRSDVNRILHEPVRGNNTWASETVIAIDLPALTTDAPVAGDADPQEWLYYRFDVESGEPLVFSLDGDGPFELYVRRDLPPTLHEYDASGQLPAQSHQEVRVFEPRDGVYYVAVVNRDASARSFAVSAEVPTLAIREVSPGQVSAGDDVTIHVVGDAFDPSVSVDLVAPDGTITSGAVFYQDPSDIYATFDLRGVAAGTGYDVVVTNPDLQSVSQVDAIDVVPDAVATFDASISIPGLSRPGRVITATVTYTNSGTVDISSPILRLESGEDDFQWQLPGRDSWITGAEFQILALSSDGPATTLRPGQTETIEVRIRVPFRTGDHTITLYSMGATPTDGSLEAIDWDEFEADTRPSSMEDETWNAVLANLQTQVGPTWGDYAKAIRENADRWFAAGKRDYCVRELFGMEMDEAQGLSTSIVAGLLVDHVKGTSVAGTMVLGSHQASGVGFSEETDAEGRFYLYGVPAGELLLEAFGWETQTGGVVTVPGADSVVTCIFTAIQTAQVKGAVLDADTGAPVEAATVYLRGEDTGYLTMASTGPDGRFSFDDAPPEVYTLLCQADGYVDEIHTNIALASGEFLNTVFHVAPAAAIWGLVNDESSGAPLADATITLVNGQNTLVVSSDDMGRFDLTTAPAGTYYVQATHNEYIASAYEVVELVLGTATQLDFDLVKGAALSGTVTDAVGLPLEDVVVTATTASGMLETAFTDSNGDYLLTGLDAGTADVQVECDGWAPAIRSTAAMALGTTVSGFDFQLTQLSEITGVVQNSSGAAVADAEIILATNSGILLSCETDAYGAFSIASSGAGVYYVHASAEAKLPATAVFELQESDPMPHLTFQLEDAAEITGTVTGPSGAVAQALVQAISHDDEILAASVTDDDGTYRLTPLPMDNVTIRVIHDDLMFPSAEVEITSAAPIERDFVACQGGVYGHIFSAQDSAPIEDAVVMAVLRGGVGVGQFLLTTTDAQGAYEMQGLADGDYLLVVEADGLARSVVEHTLSGQSQTQVDVPLAAGTLVLGSVVDHDQMPIPSAALLVQETQWGEDDPGVIIQVDENGEFSFDGLPAGEYTVLIIADGYVQKKIQWMLPNASPQVVELANEGHTLEVHVVDQASGLPLAGAVVWVAVEGYLPISAETDADGSVSLSKLPEGKARLVTNFFAQAAHDELLLTSNQSAHLVLLSLAGQSSTGALPNASLATGETGAAGYAAANQAPSTDSASTSRADLTTPAKLFDYVLDLDNIRNIPESVDLAWPTSAKCPDSFPTYRALLEERLAISEKDSELVAQRLQVTKNIHKLQASRKNHELDLKLIGELRLFTFLGITDFAVALNERDWLGIAGGVADFFLIAVGSVYEKGLLKAIATAGGHAKSVTQFCANGKAIDLRAMETQANHLSSALQILKARNNLKENIAKYIARIDNYENRLAVYEAGNRPCKPPPVPPDTPQDTANNTASRGMTPEDKFGPTGYDSAETEVGSEVRFVNEDQSFAYRVDFWNKPDAVVPTQDAIIIDRLDPAVFDLSTLDITRVGFLDWEFDVAGGQLVDTRIDCRPEMNIAVEIKAGLGMTVPGFANNDDIDPNTLVFWFHTIDPETGEWPEDPMAGFLPPFDPETEFEIGWIEFTVDPVAALPTGTQLTNVVYVEFDFAGDIYDHPAPKVDPNVEPAEPAPWINTIDAAGPTSSVLALPASSANEVITVRWSGQDDALGSGVAAYDIYVSVDDDPFELWLDETTDTEALYVGSLNHTYAFYSIAVDHVGHREQAPAVPDAVTEISEFNLAPTLAQLTVTPAVVLQTHSVTITATGADDGDGSVVRVAFYHDADGDGAWDQDLDQYLGTDEDDSDGWSLNITTAGWNLGSRTLFALAQDNRGAWSETVETTVTVQKGTSRDTSPPSASLSAADVTAAGGTTHLFTITYSDDVAVDVTTLGEENLRVRGPGMYQQQPTLLGVDQPSDGSMRVATYQITAPNGTWAAEDSGVYEVWILPLQVGDLGHNYASCGRLGTFAVTIEPSLVGDVPTEPETEVSDDRFQFVDGQLRLRPNQSLASVGETAITVWVTIPDTSSGADNNPLEIPVSVQTTGWRNPSDRYDVSGDELVSSLDALIVITELNRVGGLALPLLSEGVSVTAPFLDPSGDYQLSPLDALMVITRLNNPPQSEGEGEAEGESHSTSLTSVDTEEAIQAVYRADMFVATANSPIRYRHQKREEDGLWKAGPWMSEELAEVLPEEACDRSSWSERARRRSTLLQEVTEELLDVDSLIEELAEELVALSPV